MRPPAAEADLPAGAVARTEAPAAWVQACSPVLSAGCGDADDALPVPFVCSNPTCRAPLLTAAQHLRAILRSGEGGLDPVLLPDVGLAPLPAPPALSNHRSQTWGQKLAAAPLRHCSDSCAADHLARGLLKVWTSQQWGALQQHADANLEQRQTLLLAAQLVLGLPSDLAICRPASARSDLSCVRMDLAGGLHLRGRSLRRAQLLVRAFNCRLRVVLHRAQLLASLEIPAGRRGAGAVVGGDGGN